MACCPHGHAPATSYSLSRFCRVDGRSQFTLRLQSESSHCRSSSSSSSEDDDVRMVVEVRLRFRVRFTVPSPEQGRSYLFEPAEPPAARSVPPIHGDPAQHFSSPDAALETLAPLFSSRLASGCALGLMLGKAVGSFARATVAGARIAGGQGPIRVLADVEYLHLLRSHQEVDRCLRDLNRGMNAESSTIGTCAVCLEEIKQEWLRTIQLRCSHSFHLNCISPWLQRKNSCPICRATLPQVEHDARAIEPGFIYPVYI